MAWPTKMTTYKCLQKFSLIHSLGAFPLYFLCTCVFLFHSNFSVLICPLWAYHPLLYCSFFLRWRRRPQSSRLLWNQTKERSKITTGNKIMLRKKPHNFVRKKIYIFFIPVNSCNILRVFPLVPTHSHRWNIFSYSV